MTRLRKRRSASETLLAPVILMTMTLVGLAAGLAGEGRLSILAWIGTGVPALVALAGVWRGRPRQQPSRSATSTRRVAARSRP